MTRQHITSAWTEVQSEVALPDVAEEQCEKVGWSLVGLGTSI